MGNQTKEQYTIRHMQAADIVSVNALEEGLFYDEWSNETWLSEINNNISDYIIMEIADKIIGYAGYWLVAGEAQITRVAIAKSSQGKGLGKIITKELIARAKAEGAFAMSLEVRESNISAKKVYEDNGFVEQGVRHNYYHNHENAILMWLDLK